MLNFFKTRRYLRATIQLILLSGVFTLAACGGDPGASSGSSSGSSTSSSNSSSSGGNSSSGGTNYSYQPIQNGCNGWASRYWDCCKPHCGWNGNTPSIVEPLESCSTNNQPVSIDEGSACSNGDGHMCWDLAPYAVNDKLAFGYAAVPASDGDICGRCYQIDFTGQGRDSANDPGSVALAGKTMIVQATNIGGDVQGGQFDILVPGGGVGAFNACSDQWGVSNDELGAQYGGMLRACKDSLGWNATRDQYKSCLKNRCQNVFGSRGLTELENGCLFYVDWFEAADNPALKYKEVACPAELTNGTGMDRGPLNDISNSCGN